MIETKALPIAPARPRAKAQDNDIQLQSKLKPGCSSRLSNFVHPFRAQVMIPCGLVCVFIRTYTHRERYASSLPRL